MLNHIVVMGRLTRDPELRMTQNGTPVVSFSVAVDRDFVDRETGNRQTDFIDVVAWRNTAEFISRNFNKGKMAIVLGRLQIRDWTDKEGGKRRSAEIVADTVYFGETRKDEEARTGGVYGGGGAYNQGGGYGNPPAYGNQGGNYGGNQYGNQNYSNQAGYGQQNGYGNNQPSYNSYENNPSYGGGYNSQGYNSYQQPQNNSYGNDMSGYVPNDDSSNIPAPQSYHAPISEPPASQPSIPTDAAFTELDDPELPF